MSTKSAINFITAKIVESHFPNESSTYLVLSDQIIDNALKGELSTNMQGDKGDFNFVDEANLVVGFASVVISLSSMYISYKKKKQPELKNIMNKWKNLLIKNGLSEKEADSIVEEYSDLVIEKLLESIKDEA